MTGDQGDPWESARSNRDLNVGSGGQDAEKGADHDIFRRENPQDLKIRS